MKIPFKPVMASVSATILLGAASGVVAAENPFGAQPLEGGYMQLAHADKAKEGKCGGDATKASEAKCGADAAKASEDKKAREGKCGEQHTDKATEGKCGEGKCGGDASAHE